MRSSALVIVMLAACSQTEERAAVEAVASTAPDRIAPGVPHGAVISRVALAEHGDAALTIDNLGELLEQLRAGGVEVIQGPQSDENGKFAWIMDPEENKIELWEPKVWDDKNKGA